MEVATARSGIPIRLTDERWEHIVHYHPEMRWQRARVLDAIAGPDLIQEGDFGVLLASRYYSQESFAHGFIVAVYREVNESDGFVITAYFARRLSAARRILWNR